MERASQIMPDEVFFIVMTLSMTSPGDLRSAICIPL